MSTKLRNQNAERDNPCLKEQELTYKCFNDNNFDKEPCQLHIQNYNTCKGFWNSVRLERKRRGIDPPLPPIEERDQIKKDYITKAKQ